MAPTSPTLKVPDEVEIVSKPDVGPGLDIRDGPSLTSIVQLAIDARLVPQVVERTINSGGPTLGAPSVIADVPALETVAVCGTENVPCAVEGKVSELGVTLTALGVTLLDATDAGPGPTALAAVTVKV